MRFNGYFQKVIAIIGLVWSIIMFIILIPSAGFGLAFLSCAVSIGLSILFISLANAFIKDADRLDAVEKKVNGVSRGDKTPGEVTPTLQQKLNGYKVVEASFIEKEIEKKIEVSFIKVDNNMLELDDGSRINVTIINNLNNDSNYVTFNYYEKKYSIKLVSPSIAYAAYYDIQQAIKKYNS